MQANTKTADRAELRRFGLVVGAIIAVLFGVGLPFLLGLAFPVWPWVIGVLLIVPAIVAPQLLALVYKGWIKLGFLLNKIVSPVVMGVLFFIVFLPFGVVMRIFGKDPLHLALQPQADTYRRTSSPISDSEKPF